MGSKEQFGALGKCFEFCRLLQAVSLIAIIGITANFVSQIASSHQKVPSILIATLVISTITALWTFLAWAIYRSNWLWILTPLVISDLLILVACIAVASVLGKPLASLDCSTLPTGSANTSSWIASVAENINKYTYIIWIGANQTACYETKAVWGLSMVLCILFFLTTAFAVVMKLSVKTAPKSGDEESNKNSGK